MLQEQHEGAWLELKHNNCAPDVIGKIISACANAAMLADRDRAFIVWGIENKTKERVGTTVMLNELKKGGESLINWLTRKIDPRLMLEPLDFTGHEKQFDILALAPRYDRPVKFDGVEYIRVGKSIKSLKDFSEHERALWLATGRRKFNLSLIRRRVRSPFMMSEKLLSRHFALSERSKRAGAFNLKEL